jgi:hypothetical protein
MVSLSSESDLATREPLSLHDLNGHALPYSCEARYDELLYCYEKHIANYGLSVELRPKIIDYAGMYTPDLAADELVLSTIGYPEFPHTVQRSFSEEPTQTIYVAMSLRHGREPLVQLRDYFIERSQEKLAS